MNNDQGLGTAPFALGKFLLGAVALGGAVCGGWLYIKTQTPNVAEPLIAAVAATQATTTATASTFKILIVPGHDTDTGGAHFKDIYERDIVVTVAQKISALLGSETGYDITVSRDTKAWNPILQTYFDTNEQAIIDWKSGLQAAEKNLLSSGQKQFVPDMASHSNVDKKTSVELYGINKWANENDVDLVLHLHFNDSGRDNMNVPGSYKGYTIFIPESQRKNSTTSRAIAKDINIELKKEFSPEAVGGDKDGLIEDQSLIALGASDTLSKPAILIEYGYVYEKGLLTETDREKTLSDMAARTAAGIEAYIASLKEKQI